MNTKMVYWGLDKGLRHMASEFWPGSRVLKFKPEWGPNPILRVVWPSECTLLVNLSPDTISCCTRNEICRRYMHFSLRTKGLLFRASTSAFVSSLYTMSPPGLSSNTILQRERCRWLFVVPMVTKMSGVVSPAVDRGDGRCRSRWQARMSTSDLRSQNYRIAKCLRKVSNMCCSWHNGNV